MTKLEAIAQALWESWGPYAKSTVCAVCSEYVYCRSKAGKRYVCLGCFDQGHK